MLTLKWFLFLLLCLSCGYALMFSSLRDKGKDPQGKVPCGGHFRSRQTLPEHAHSWLGSKWLWVVFVFVVYVVLKFRGDSEKSKVRMVRIGPFCLGDLGGFFYTFDIVSEISDLEKRIF